MEMKKSFYEINSIINTYYVDDLGKFQKFDAKSFCPIYRFDLNEKEKALEKMKELKCECTISLEATMPELDDEYVTYSYLEYEMIEIENYKVKEIVKENLLKDNDTKFTEDFFKKLLLKLNKSKDKINYHKWIKNPTTEQILELQNIQKLD